MVPYMESSNARTNIQKYENDRLFDSVAFDLFVSGSGVFRGGGDSSKFVSLIKNQL